MKWEEILKVDYDPRDASERVARWHRRVKGTPEKRIVRRTGQQRGIGHTKDSSRVQAYLSQLELIFNGFNISKYYDHYTEEILGKNKRGQRKKALLDWLNDTLSDDEKIRFSEPFENSILEFLLEALEIWADIPLKSRNKHVTQTMLDHASTESTRQKYTSIDNVQRELWPDNVKQYLTGEEE